MRGLFVVASALLAAGLAGTAWAIGELRYGVGEVSQHWWSSAPLVLFALGGMLLALAWLAPRLSVRRSKSF